MTFWERPQGAARFKHAVLTQYATTFASKVGKFSPNHEVAILDGYAGRGWYEDGSPGSPAIMVGTAEKLSKIRTVRCWFVEEDNANYKALSSGLAKLWTTGPRPRALHGTMSDHLQAILSESERIPIFALIDPFGLGLPFWQLTDVLMARGRRPFGGHAPSTEVLVNFVHAGIYRNAGMLSVQSDDVAQLKAAATKVEELNDNLGGDWWQQICRERQATDVLVRRIRDEYVKRVLHSAGPSWRCVQVPVSDRPLGATIYHLLFFTQHRQGVWFFNDAVSLGRQVFQQKLDEDRQYLQLSLLQPEDEWPSIIKRNLLLLLKRGRRVPVVEQIEDVYGDLLGIARGKHVKAAAKLLAEEGLNVGSCRCEPDKLILVPPVFSQRHE